MRQPAVLVGIFLCLAARTALAAPPVAPQVIEAYLKPFVETDNFSGTVLVTEKGQAIYEKTFGFADLAGNVPNTADTRFHVASLSILFTAFATMRLVEQGKLSLDDTAGKIVGPLPNGDRITVRELLEEDSGLPDFNDLPNYDALVAVHQTSESVVDTIRNLKPRTEPGGKSQEEEHSACNVLALIIEKKTGLPFAQAMQKLVFEPAGMKDSGVDDDSPIGGQVALGYRPEGESGLTQAKLIHWSAKPGNGSAYSTADDLNRWWGEFMGDRLLSAKTRETMLATDADTGFGWDYKGPSKRFDGPLYLMNGRGPGFSAIVIYLPKESVTVILVSNIEHDMNPSVAEDIASITVGKPFKPFSYQPYSMTPEQRRGSVGRFKFGADFYRSNGTLEIKDSPQGLLLEWPGGPEAPLLPIGPDSFMDRYYWSPVSIVRDSAEHPSALKFGKFQGSLVSESKH